jgi:hypothetical protein
MDVPLGACASYRLNLAVRQRLQQFSDELESLQALMVKLLTLTQSAKLQ